MKKQEFKDTVLGDIEVVGTGQISVEIKKPHWKIPQLQFIVYFSKEDECFTAFCIDLQIYYSHTDELKTLNGMLDNITSSLISMGNKSDRVEILDEILTEAPADLYRIYKISNASLVNNTPTAKSDKNPQPMPLIYKEVEKNISKKNKNNDDSRVSDFSLYSQGQACKEFAY